MKKTSKNNINLLDKKISSNVLKIKTDLGLKTSDLAEALGLEDVFIRGVESFKKKYNVRHLFILINYFNEKNNSSHKYKDGISWYHIFPECEDDLIEKIKTEKNRRVNNDK